MEGHAIHRIHEFLPHLAKSQPDLLTLLPEAEQPHSDASLTDWVLSLPQNRLMEICTAWVLESLRRLKQKSPLTNVLLRGCLHLAGEFDLSDAAAVAVGEAAPPGHPRRDEIRAALNRAARLGVLIHLPREERYCIPFPVRLSFEGVDFLEPIERESIRLRMIQHFSLLCRDLQEQPDLATPKYWRFSNILAAYELAVDMMEELLGLEAEEWTGDWQALGDLPAPVAEPLVDFGRFLGQALVTRASESGARLLAASAAAARFTHDKLLEARMQALLGQFHLRRGQFKRAIEAYRQGEALQLGAGNVEGVVLAISAIALAHREMGNVELAVAEFLRACALARQSALFEQEIDTANCAVRLMIKQDRAFEAIHLVNQVMDSQQLSSRRYPAVAELLVMLGVALRMEGREADSRDRFFAALGLARTFSHRPAEAQACLELGRLYATQHNHDEALKWMRRGRALYAELSDASGLAQCYLELSRSLRAIEQGAEGEELLVKALRNAQAAKDMDLIASIWHERAEIALENGDPQQVIGFAHQEIKALRHTHAVDALVAAHLRVGELYLRQEAYLAAGTEILRAQGLSRLYLREDNSQKLDDLLTSLRPLLTNEQFEFLVQEVSEELEAGLLKNEETHG